MFLELIFLALAIPAGFFIASITKDELSSGQKYFKILICASLVVGALSFLYGKIYISWTMGFILIVSLISLKKSFGKI